jgi:hypothetical protein
MDFAGPLPASGPQHHDIILIVIDKLTKQAHLKPCHSTDTAADTAQLIFNHIVTQHGMPRIIISDRDSKFTSIFWKTLFHRFGTKLSMSTPFHPQTDGQSERMVRTTKEMLRHYVNYRQDNWLKQLPALEFAYDSSGHPSTGMSPFELDLGQQPLRPLDCLTNDKSEVPESEDFVALLQALQTEAQDAILNAQLSQGQYYDKGRKAPRDEKDDLVMVSTTYIHPPFIQGAGSKKIKAKFIGPFKVLEKKNPTSYLIELPSHIKVHPVIDVQYL